jgi:large subunit ribosomal protein L4
MLNTFVRRLARQQLIKGFSQLQARESQQLASKDFTLPATNRAPSGQLYQQIQNRLTLEKVPFCQVMPWNLDGFPKLVRKADSVLIKYWWSETPFDIKTQLIVPIFTFENNTFTNQVIELDHLIFNQPIRRDIIHRVLHWSLMFGKKTTHRTRNPADVAGSGVKPRPQKGQGRARLGNKRASGRYHGGKIWGHTPKDFTFHIPEKVKIRGLVSTLSGKLAEGKVRIYDTEKLPEHKTKLLDARLPKDGFKETFLFVAPKDADRNFILAARNIERIKVVDPNSVCVRDLLKFDKVIFTVQSLKEFSQLLLAYMFMLEKPKAIKDRQIEDMLNLNFSRVDPDVETPVYDPSQPWEPRFEILKDYYRMYQENKEKNRGGENKESN